MTGWKEWMVSTVTFTTMACASSSTGGPTGEPGGEPGLRQAPEARIESSSGEPTVEPGLRQAPEARIDGRVVSLAYSGFRRGQHPDRGQGAVEPTDAEIEEDLSLLADHGVELIRMYDMGAVSMRTLEIIAKENLPIRVVQGAWLRAELSAHETCAWLTEPVPEAELAANRQMNEREVEQVIAVANRYRDIVVAVNVGNEALVTWNDHLVPIERMVGYLKQVKAAIAQPVTTADNYVAWAEHGEALMAHADFAFVHTYPVWEGKSVEDAMAYTRANLMQVREALPSAPIAIGEAGWPTVASEFGDRANAENQARYVEDLLAFGEAHNMTVFVFEAFDEDWKGNADPDGAEKHWGLFDIDRRPKLGVKTGRLLPRPTP